MSGLAAESDGDDDSDHLSEMGVRHEDTDDDDDDDDSDSTDDDDDDDDDDDEEEDSPGTLPADAGKEGSQSPSGDRDDASVRSGRRRSSNNSRQSSQWDRVIVASDGSAPHYDPHDLGEMLAGRSHSPISVPHDSPKSLADTEPDRSPRADSRASRRMSLPVLPPVDDAAVPSADTSGINISIPQPHELQQPFLLQDPPTLTKGPAKTEEEVELDSWNDALREQLDEVAGLTAALAVQNDRTGKRQRPDEAVEVLRVIVHHLQVAGNADVVNTIRREAQANGMALVLNPEVQLAGKDRNRDAGTELHQKVQESLYYLPPLDGSWGNYMPWPTRNYRKEVIVMKESPWREPQQASMVPLHLLIDRLFLDKENMSDYPYKVPITHTFTQEFFLMYSEFVAPDQLLTFIGRFYLDIPDALMYSDRDTAIRTRVLRVLAYWIKYMVVDFTERLLIKARSLCHVALRRLGKSADPEVLQAAGFLLSVIDDALSQGTPRVAPRITISLADHEQPEPILDGVTPGVALSSIGSFNEVEVARQLCLLIHDDFAAIRVREFFRGGWQEGNDLWPITLSMRKAVRYVAADLLDWVGSQLQGAGKVHNYRRFVRVSYHCLKMNNFAASQTIYAKLDSLIKKPVFKGCLSRVRNGKLPSEEEMFEELAVIHEPFSSVARNELIDQAVQGSQPCLPLMASFQQYFVRMDEAGESASVAKGPGRDVTVLVNWKKMSGIASKAITITCLQSRPYNFKVVPEIRKLLEELPRWNAPDSEDTPDPTAQAEAHRPVAPLAAEHPRGDVLLEEEERPQKKPFKKIRSFLSRSFVKKGVTE